MVRRSIRRRTRGRSQGVKPDDSVSWLPVSRQEAATILAALWFHRDENLQGDGRIPDKVVQRIATDGGRLAPLTFEEVGRLYARLSRTLRRVTSHASGQGGHR
jgi:hypothetical protein